MKTLILNGSTRKNGDTAALLNEFTKHLHGDVMMLSHEDNISPCRDCRYCWKNSGCSIQDKMQEVYAFLEECDHVVIASPVWFSSLTGPLLNIASRMQTLFAARFFRGETTEADKNGVIFLVGAEPGTQEMPEKAALTILKQMHVRRPCVATVYCMNTDKVPACRDKTALQQAREAAYLLNKLCEKPQK